MRISDWSSDVCSSDLLLAPEDRIQSHAHDRVEQRLAVGVGGRCRDLVVHPQSRDGIETQVEDQAVMVADRGVDHMRAVQPGGPQVAADLQQQVRSEEHTSEPQSPMRTAYAVFCLKKKKHHTTTTHNTTHS